MQRTTAADVVEEGLKRPLLTMDHWEKNCTLKQRQYHRRRLVPLYASYNFALKAKTERCFTGFCIESCSGVMNLCAERVAALNMFVNSGQTVVKRMIAIRDAPPCGGEAECPGGAARVFHAAVPAQQRCGNFVNYETRETIT